MCKCRFVRVKTAQRKATFTYKILQGHFFTQILGAFFVGCVSSPFFSYNRKGY